MEYDRQPRWHSSESKRPVASPPIVEDNANGFITRPGSDQGVPQPPFIPRNDIINEIKQHFRESEHTHGVRNEKVLLWGLSGCGKRRLATQVATEVAHVDSRKVLSVEGRCFEAFIRDYRNVYKIMTGRHLPFGMSCTAALNNVKYMLEQRTHEWVLVIFDMQYILEQSTEDGSNPSLVSFLPDRGHLLMTTSCIVLDANPESSTHRQLICGLEVAHRSRGIQIQGFGDAEISQYAERASLDCHRLNLNAFKAPSTPTTSALRMALITTSIRLTDIDTTQYYDLFRFRADELVHQKQEGNRSIVATFAVTMNILWDIVADHDKLALKLLAFLTVVDRRGVPLSLVQKLRISIATGDYDFNATLDLLSSSGILEIEDLGVGDLSLSIPLLVFRWLRVKVRDTFEKWEYDELILEWVDVFNEHLNEDFLTFNRDKCWDMIAHAWTIMSCISSQAISSLEILVYMIKFSHFLVQDGLLPNYAGIFISQALNMCTDFQTQFPDAAADYNESYVRIKQIRSKAFSLIGKYRLSEGELQDAKYRLGRLPESPSVLQIQQELEDAEVDLLINLERYDEAEHALYRLLRVSTSQVDPVITSRRYYCMSVTLSAQGVDVAALQYSHMAMGHWRSLPPDERLGQKDLVILRMVEKHADLLQSMGKYKGAILFLSKMFEYLVTIDPMTDVTIWRCASNLVFCYKILEKVMEAEKVVCKMLSLFPIQRAEGLCLTYAIFMLHDMASLLLRYGSTVAAEGVFRFNIQTCKKRKVLTLDNTRKYHPLTDWAKLIVCLLRQGKMREAKKVYHDHQNGDHGSKLQETLIADALKADRHVMAVYERTLEAEAEETAIEWKALLNSDFEARTASRYAKQLFGSPKWRLREGPDFASDINIHRVRTARSSRILHLLDRNLVYLSFANGFAPPEDDEEAVEDDEELWCNMSQRILGEFWPWCECRRKRNRSQSINPVDLIEKKHAKRADYESSRPRRLKQKLITDWITITRDWRSTPSCPESSCPCIEANKMAAEAFANLESTLFTYTDKSVNELNARKKRKARYRKQSFNRSPVPEEYGFLLGSNGDLTWMHHELATTSRKELEDENYIIPNAIDIPIIVVSPPKDENGNPIPVAITNTKVNPTISGFFEKETVSKGSEELKYWHHPHRLEDILEDDEDEISHD